MEVVAGVRPCRRGGLRIESVRETAGPLRKSVVHNYGQGGCGYTVGLGCAEAAADLVDAELGLEPPREHGDGRALEGGTARGSERSNTASIAVLGAGIVGLYTARELLARGHRVAIYADRVIAGTASAIAGGLWLPTGLNFGDTPDRVEWFLGILRRSRTLLDELDPARYAVERLPVYEPEWADDPERYFNNGTIGPRRPIGAIPIEGLEARGLMYEAPFIHTPVHARAILDDIRTAGGSIVEHRFDSLREVLELDEPLIVNCTALGSRDLFGDDGLFGARGVLAKFEPQPLGYIWHDNYRYIFPRSDALIVGGSFEEGIEDADAGPEAAEEIIRSQRKTFGLDPGSGGLPG